MKKFKIFFQSIWYDGNFICLVAGLLNNICNIKIVSKSFPNFKKDLKNQSKSRP